MENLRMDNVGRNCSPEVEVRNIEFFHALPSYVKNYFNYIFRDSTTDPLMELNCLPINNHLLVQLYLVNGGNFDVKNREPYIKLTKSSIFEIIFDSDNITSVILPTQSKQNDCYVAKCETDNPIRLETQLVKFISKHLFEGIDPVFVTDTSRFKNGRTYRWSIEIPAIFKSQLMELRTMLSVDYRLLLDHVQFSRDASVFEIFELRDEARFLLNRFK